MKRTLILIMMLSFLLSGCSGFLDSSYVFVETHPLDTDHQEQIISVSDYSSLLSILRKMVEEGTESGIISVVRYNPDRVATDMASAVEYVLHRDPIGSYAVEDIQYDLGTSAGQSAVSIEITYLHSRSELQKIHRPKNWEQAEKVITEALNNCEAGVVLYLQDYQEVDFAQWVAAYATARPDRVIESPTVTANIYPDFGSTRVVELKFAYQNTRDSLRAMQKSVMERFGAAIIYASGEAEQQDQYFRLYSFLMGSPQIQVETSLTPAYSLLQHGVGDSRAFATVYAAMSVRSGLECYVVTGTRAGEPWYWNIICCNGVYYHLDLLSCHEADDFDLLLDQKMSGYVWDYSAYPVCNGEPVPQSESKE